MKIQEGPRDPPDTYILTRNPRDCFPEDCDGPLPWTPVPFEVSPPNSTQNFLPIFKSFKYPPRRMGPTHQNRIVVDLVTRKQLSNRPRTVKGFVKCP